MIGKFTFTEKISIENSTGDAYVDGRFVAGPTTVISDIRASVQPMGPREIQRLPEGFRTREPLVVYMDVANGLELLEDDRAVIEPGSVILYNGGRYAVVPGTWKYPDTMRQAHWKVAVVRED